jgi:hypothetical protein
MDDIKQFLYSWLGKNRKTPNYDISQMKSKNQARFKCEVRVQGYDYVGVGNSTNKKSAQNNAAYDFCQYLARIGCFNASDIPALVSVSLLLILSSFLEHSVLSVFFIRKTKVNQAVAMRLHLRWTTKPVRAIIEPCRIRIEDSSFKIHGPFMLVATEEADKALAFEEEMTTVPVEATLVAVVFGPMTTKCFKR